MRQATQPEQLTMNLFIYPAEPSEAARELYLYTRNCAAAWCMAEAAFRNYERKRAKGQYDAALARKGLIYAVEQAARLYTLENGAPGDKWHALFLPADRRAAAHLIMTDTEAEWACGNSWSN
jgi:hypothetical protein